ncbi:hypothetical protein Tco_0832292 [Tanacetum coccineum]
MLTLREQNGDCKLDLCLFLTSVILGSIGVFGLEKGTGAGLYLKEADICIAKLSILDVTACASFESEISAKPTPLVCFSIDDVPLCLNEELKVLEITDLTLGDDE